MPRGACARESPAGAVGDTPSSETPTESTRDLGADQTAGVPLTKVIDMVAHKTGKKYVLDSRVHAQVQLIGEDLNRITYPELLTILKLYGFTAVDSGGYLLVVPESIVRAMPLPSVTDRDAIPILNTSPP